MKSGSRLEKILTSGGFAVTGELGPPKSGDPEVVRKKAGILKGHVDAVNITDCQTAIVRMSSIAAGLITLQEGVEPVIQMTCRDRNRIGMQSDILGAAALGLKNLLCLTGDHQKFGNHPGSKGVFDMDSIQLLGMVRGMRDEKKFQCGEAIKSAEPRLFLGCAANPFANPFEFRAPRLAKKVASGADFVQTQIIYNVEKFARFMEMVCDLGLDEKVYILAGVTPPKSLGMARYMKSSVPGMDVTDEVISRMKDAADKQEEGINICVDIINRVKEIKGVSGVHIMAIEWEEAVPEIVKRAKLGPRPVFDEDVRQPAVKAAEAIEVTAPAAQPPQPSVDTDKLLAEARAEAEKIIAGARAEVEKMRAQAVPQTTVGSAPEYEDAGEHEMNEKERQMALQSVQMGLNALKKAFNLSDEQFEALSSFASAEAVLKRQPPETATAGAVTAPAAAEAVKPAPDKAAEEANKAAEARAAEEAKKAAEVKAAEEGKKAAEGKAADEAKKATEAKATEEAQKVAEAKKAAETKAAEEAQKAAAAKVDEAPKAAAPAGDLAVAELAVEKTPFADRAKKIPAASYQIKYTGQIKETLLGSGDKTIKVGGESSMPFHLFEGAMPNKPLIAMDVLDVKPDEWPDTLTRHFAGVLDNPLAWARKCVDEYQAEAICISMVSTDPNGMNRKASEAAKVAAEVINKIDVPIIVWGCGNADKDTETLREITSLTGDKKVCLAPLSDSNYRSLGATAMAFRYPMVAASPIDVNLAKQLNILLENLGVSLNSILMDPSIGALGYGIEYTYSVMERIRLAALTQQDEKLQVPIICNLGREVWKAKECRLPSDAVLGDQERRGIMMEAITATCMLLSGGEVLIMRHPKAINLTKSLINSLIS
ncbi:MAG: acetyl-CoA decarbonylase/synthase complex subunit delta [Proteobacteria bacterium]|nr:acetyl-CoA decarbonylase/synthase complex subunit delta [Pseudomonadota bacterium]MBU4295642.1 acetyl-CoA decarbonylase/synthase complex subunit delta [Pseudomonadota bacterium]